MGKFYCFKCDLNRSPARTGAGTVNRLSERAVALEVSMRAVSDRRAAILELFMSLRDKRIKSSQGTFHIQSATYVSYV